jgi:hypothetical protein
MRTVKGGKCTVPDGVRSITRHSQTGIGDRQVLLPGWLGLASRSLNIILWLVDTR